MLLISLVLIVMGALARPTDIPVVACAIDTCSIKVGSWVVMLDVRIPVQSPLAGVIELLPRMIGLFDVPWAIKEPETSSD